MESETINKYIDGKVYKLVHSNTDRIYIGSTTESLKDRYYFHNHKSNITSSKTLFCIEGNVKIELIEAYPCNSKIELKEKERYYIELNKDKVVNKNIPNRTKKDSSAENYKKNKDKRKVEHKEYYEKHKTDIIEKHKIYTEGKKEELKQYFKDRYEKIKEQRKIYNAQKLNTPESKAYQKEYNKNYRIKNKEKLQLLNKQKWQTQKNIKQDIKQDI